MSEEENVEFFDIVNSSNHCANTHLLSDNKNFLIHGHQIPVNYYGSIIYKKVGVEPVSKNCSNLSVKTLYENLVSGFNVAVAPAAYEVYFSLSNTAADEYDKFCGFIKISDRLKLTKPYHMYWHNIKVYYPLVKYIRDLKNGGVFDDENPLHDFIKNSDLSAEEILNVFISTTMALSCGCKKIYGK